LNKHLTHLTPILFLLFLLTSLSCGRIREKSSRAVSLAKARIITKKDAMVDKVFTRFDAHTPDTKANKKRFQEFFGFEPGADVKNLYCLNETFSMDAGYYFAFTCDDSTRHKIVDFLALRPDKTNMGFGGGLFSNPTNWWDTAAIGKLLPYTRVEGNLSWYLWYDRTTDKAYFFTFNI
jgi:hypothetical protein